ncbi:aldo/keto reductase [Trinickia mobilis]|uniref:aldo/keto reductase n=1 Tax=Trinickia mobilis TaxID=2816356 RepID=UPI002867B049|nr:aldo/keto reductase [Trinickia mobilis]
MLAALRDSHARPFELCVVGMKRQVRTMLGMGMTYADGTRNDEESIATIHCALEWGVTMFDTTEVYGPYSQRSGISAPGLPTPRPPYSGSHSVVQWLPDAHPRVAR